ncbi:LANO_0G18294g1_1 [Lachancea nothofagi CBS 11611]|uniref:LANO_0G18294g1_1 n=1 Tax=Lachancea nothofagi CBS 11611 TaxID=1266666 RepID=A0A1G4KKK9_9SACH|nr:LANO_0G18294g1_1 [Lachancea nothofagi CBS 11611]
MKSQKQSRGRSLVSTTIFRFGRTSSTTIVMSDLKIPEPAKLVIFGNDDSLRNCRKQPAQVRNKLHKYGISRKVSVKTLAQNFTPVQHICLLCSISCIVRITASFAPVRAKVIPHSNFTRIFQYLAEPMKRKASSRTKHKPRRPKHEARLIPNVLYLNSNAV